MGHWVDLGRERVSLFLVTLERMSSCGRGQGIAAEGKISGWVDHAGAVCIQDVNLYTVMRSGIMVPTILGRLRLVWYKHSQQPGTEDGALTVQ